MITKIKKLSTSKGIIFPKDFMEFHGLKVGDFVNIDDIFKVEKKER